MELDVVFRNKEQQKLVGTLAYPAGKENYPGVVLCHGFTGNKEGHFFPSLSEALVAEGFAVLRFDCRHCGKSEGKVHSTYKNMADDIDSAVAFLKKQDRVQEIGIAGHSMGGTSVLVVAAHDKSIKAVVTFAAVAYPAASVAKKKQHDFKKQPDNTYTIIKHDRLYVFDETFFKDAESIKPLELVPQLSTPLLIIHGTSDGTIDLDQGKQLFLRASTPKSIKMIDGADHCFREHFEPLIESTISFFKKHLSEKKE